MSLDESEMSLMTGILHLTGPMRREISVYSVTSETVCATQTAKF